MIGELQCSDPDPGDSHTFQLLTGWDVFHVAPGGVLTVARPLDYERTRRYDVMVRCADSGQPTMSVTQVLSFAVKNLNEKPTNISLSHLEVGCCSFVFVSGSSDGSLFKTAFLSEFAHDKILD